jgi:hypothetical protein
MHYHLQNVGKNSNRNTASKVRKSISFYYLALKNLPLIQYSEPDKLRM